MHGQLNLRTDHAKERNAKDKVLSVNVGWQLEARRWALTAESEKFRESNSEICGIIVIFFTSVIQNVPGPLNVN